MPENVTSIELPPSMRMVLQFGKVISPARFHDALRDRAVELHAQYRSAGAYKAEGKLMRIIQDGIDFGKWPA